MANLKDFLAEYKTLLMIIGIALLSALLLFFLFFGIGSGAPEPLEVVAVSPRPGEQKVISFVGEIKFQFSYPLDIETLKYDINPLIDLEYQLEDNGKTLVFYPSRRWAKGVNYSLTIFSGLSSEEGDAVLENDIMYIYEIQPPQDIKGEPPGF